MRVRIRSDRSAHAAVFLILILLFSGALFLAGRPAVHLTISRPGPPILSFPQEITCSPWQRVTATGMGLPSDTPESPGYAGEEGFEVLTFRGQMYVGMEADNTLGARLWRTKVGISQPERQSDWEEVIADADGRPWGLNNLSQADHIDSLAAFDGWIYASTANGGTPTGTRVFRSPSGSPGSWQDALEASGPGFGKPQNENFKDMVVSDGHLCGGTWNMVEGAEVWCTAGDSRWEQKNISGFGDPRNSIIWSTHVFADALYAGVQHRAAESGFSRLDEGRIYRTDSLAVLPQWELVFEGGRRSNAAVLLGDAGGRLYAATGSIDGIRIWSSDSGDAGSWIPASRAGMSGSRLNTGTVTDGAAVYLGRLHVAVRNPMLGFRVWRLDEDGLWRVVGDSADYPEDATAAQLAVFNDSLYAWTSGDQAGASVWRTACQFTPGSAAGSQSTLGLLAGALLTVVLGAGWVFSGRNRV